MTGGRHILMSTEPATSRLREHAFFLSIALLIVGAVFIGFARTYYLAGVFRAPLPSLLVHIHGGVFSMWILLLLAQVSLVAAGRVNLHRCLGLAGCGVACTMVILGLMVATDALARHFTNWPKRRKGQDLLRSPCGRRAGIRDSGVPWVPRTLHPRHSQALDADCHDLAPGRSLCPLAYRGSVVESSLR